MSSLAVAKAKKLASRLVLGCFFFQGNLQFEDVDSVRFDAKTSSGCHC